MKIKVGDTVYVNDPEFRDYASTGVVTYIDVEDTLYKVNVRHSSGKYMILNYFDYEVKQANYTKSPLWKKLEGVNNDK